MKSKVAFLALAFIFVCLNAFILSTGPLGLSLALVTPTPPHVIAVVESATPQPTPEIPATPDPSPTLPLTSGVVFTPAPSLSTPSPQPSETPTVFPLLPTASTPLGGGSGVIAFASDRDEINGEIYRMRLDGTELVRLTFTEGEDRSPAWSPDGQWLAFLSRRDGNPDIHLMLADGTQRKRLTTETSYDEFPSWSPDGAWLMFDSDRSGKFQLYRVRPDSTGLERLTDVSTDDAVADWAPDGQTLVFESRRESEQYQIFTLRLDGSGIVTRLTHNSFARDFHPEWSPLGDRIAFVSERDGVGALYTMRPDGTDQRRLTFTLESVRSPHWSPDGQWLLFAAATTPDNYDLYIIKADGTELYQITNHPANDFSPDWQP